MVNLFQWKSATNKAIHSIIQITFINIFGNCYSQLAVLYVKLLFASGCVYLKMLFAFAAPNLKLLFATAKKSIKIMKFK